MMNFEFTNYCDEYNDTENIIIKTTQEIIMIDGELNYH